MPKYPVIKSSQKVYQTSWFSLDEKTVEFPDSGENEKYYSINEGDHVTIVAEDNEKNILLVRQYRPAIENFLIELPGGHVEDGDPEQSARDELLEETGYKANRLELLGKVIIDSGRNQGHLYCYHARDLKRVGDGERGVELMRVNIGDLRKMILRGRFTHALNLSAILLADLKGLLLP